MQSLLEAIKNFFGRGLKLIQSLPERQVEFASRHLPKLPPGCGKMFVTWPNLISLTRIPLAEGIAMLNTTGQSGQSYGPALLLLLATYTDIFDGMLARRTGKATVSGAIIDPTCDKYLTIRCLITYRYDFWPHLAWAAIVVDLSIFVFPMLAVALRLLDQEKVDFRSTVVGKTKFFLQCVAILAVAIKLSLIASVLLTVATLIALWSIGDKLWDSRDALSIIVKRLRKSR